MVVVAGELKNLFKVCMCSAIKPWLGSAGRILSMFQEVSAINPFAAGGLNLFVHDKIMQKNEKTLNPGKLVLIR